MEEAALLGECDLIPELLAIMTHQSHEPPAPQCRRQIPPAISTNPGWRLDLGLPLMFHRTELEGRCFGIRYERCPTLRSRTNHGAGRNHWRVSACSRHLPMHTGCLAYRQGINMRFPNGGQRCGAAILFAVELLHGLDVSCGINIWSAAWPSRAAGKQEIRRLLVDVCAGQSMDAETIENQVYSGPRSCQGGGDAAECWWLCEAMHHALVALPYPVQTAVAYERLARPRRVCSGCSACRRATDGLRCRSVSSSRSPAAHSREERS